jgi:hypothetical protein
VGVDPSNFDKLVGIQDPEPSVVKLEDTVAAQVAQHPVDVNAGQTRRIADMLLSQRKLHLLDPMAWPSHSASDEELEKEVGDTLARRMTPDAR